jgi:hypothetical protein
MTDKLDRIIQKAGIWRNHQDATPLHYGILDLITALAHEMKAHVRDSSHMRTIGTLSPVGYPDDMFGPPHQISADQPPIQARMDGLPPYRGG